MLACEQDLFIRSVIGKIIFFLFRVLISSPDTNYYATIQDFSSCKHFRIQFLCSANAEFLSFKKQCKIQVLNLNIFSHDMLLLFFFFLVGCNQYCYLMIYRIWLQKSQSLHASHNYVVRMQRGQFYNFVSVLVPTAPLSPTQTLLAHSISQGPSVTLHLVSFQKSLKVSQYSLICKTHTQHLLFLNLRNLAETNQAI